jgi:hypothetical protein
MYFSGTIDGKEYDSWSNTTAGVLASRTPGRSILTGADPAF